VFEAAPYTMVANVTGQPSMSLPLHWTDEGLPMGLLFTADIGDEAALIRLASQLEQAMPWRDRRPPVAAGGGELRVQQGIRASSDVRERA
jgi:amidase/6-aminohexanoate-cyclic-dimer hydrolase